MQFWECFFLMGQSIMMIIVGIFSKSLNHYWNIMRLVDYWELQQLIVGPFFPLLEEGHVERGWNVDTMMTSQLRFVGLSSR
jgi:hypothetical protein